jgi:hypothetical protein
MITLPLVDLEACHKQNKNTKLMSAPEKFPWSFRNVCARKQTSAVFVASHEQSLQTDAPISSLMCWKGNSWVGQDSCAANGTGFVMLESPRTLMMLGKEGVVYHWLEKGGFKKESIDSSLNGPQNYGDMEEIRVIDGKAYVTGMARCVYFRNSNAVWEAIDHDIRSRDDQDAGFFSIDGYKHQEIYAVGLEGEIGVYDGNKWKLVDSPTNLILYRVLCAPNNKVYICGQKGVLLEGRFDQWRQIDQKATEQTFWGSAWFKDRLFLSTSDGIYRLEGDEVIPVNIISTNNEKLKTKKGLSFYRLDAAFGLLWSVGNKMAMWTEDGEHWNEVTYNKR